MIAPPVDPNAPSNDHPTVAGLLPTGSRQESQNVYVSFDLDDDLDAQRQNKDMNDEEQSYGASVRSELTQEGIRDPAGFSIICLVILVGDMARGVMFPTMWPLVESLGGSTVTLGYCVAAFSFGRILVNPMFGSRSISHGYPQTLTISMSIQLCGTLLYTQVPNVGSTMFLILTQTVLGIGSGTGGITRAFVADVTAIRQRTRYMAFVTSVQYAGFAMTPFVGAFFLEVLEDHDYQAGLLRFNKFTAPAYFMLIIDVITLFFVVFKLEDVPRRPKPAVNVRKSKRRTLVDDLANTTTCIGITTYDCCILACMLLNVATKGSIASFETMGINYAITHFNMYSAKAGAIVACCGTFGVFSLLSMGYLAETFSDVQLITFGLVVMAGGIGSLCTLDEGHANPNYRYAIAMFMIYAVGYPIGHTAVIGMFSKIVGRRPQGTLLGWFSSSGSIARIGFAIMSGYVSNYESILLLFIILVGVVTVAACFVLFYRKTFFTLSQ